ncbi:MAG: UDP-N-acetylmuramate--L-alanine ligase [Clostridia bacterium]|nr:UDP-N-acetylmuramate--L-alanine ligase [Clostridia bacterium]
MAIKNTNFSPMEIHNFFTDAKQIFFIGVGGVSMSSLATYTRYMGKDVYGYDSKRTKITKKLEGLCKITYKSTPDNIEGMDLVVYTGAIDEDNFEYKHAKKRGIPLVSRANFLGYVVSKYKRRIGVCGMHGKSTTTAMLEEIFTKSGRCPTVFCGAEMKSTGSCSVIGKENVCIFEACEYLDSFLCLCPTDAGVLNIDSEHLDYFKSTDEIIKSFNKFVKNAQSVYINADDPLSRSISHKSIITYGIENKADYMAEILSPDSYIVYYKGAPLVQCQLLLCGKHYIYDSLCAFAIAHSCGIAPTVISNALKGFKGVKRRMDYLGKTDTGVDIFEDYAHHPNEIKCTLNSLYQSGKNNILCVFQPHTYSRTVSLYDEFCSSFKGVGNLIILPTFSAREENIYGLSEEQFAKDCGGNLIKSTREVVEIIHTTKSDLVLLLGAGDLCGIKEALFKQ